MLFALICETCGNYVSNCGRCISRAGVYFTNYFMLPKISELVNMFPVELTFVDTIKGKKEDNYDYKASSNDNACA